MMKSITSSLLSFASTLLAVLTLQLPNLAHSSEMLFITPERLTELRGLVQQDGTHEAAAFASMKKRVDNPDMLAAYPTGGGGKYEPGFRGREAALISLLESDASAQKKYADIALEMTMKSIKGDKDQSHNQKGKLVNMWTGYGLARAIIGMNVAITYNWMQGSWEDADKKEVVEAISKALDAWPKYSHANFGRARASNWVAVCRGGELVMILASGEDSSRGERVTFLTKELSRHMKSGFGSEGVGQEGAGYIEYPGQFLLPAAYGLAQKGDDSLLKQAKEIGWWKMVMYGYTLQSQKFDDQDRKFLQWGVGVLGPHEGWVSLLFNLVPDDQVPYYTWFYDRYTGLLSAKEGKNTGFDCHRAGTTWALIYYPTGVTAKDPTGVFPPSLLDSHGFAFFRNRWQNENDIQVLAISDDVHHRNAWDQPDNLGLRLIAQNAAFIAGPGKKRDVQGYSTLLIDGKFGGKKTTSLTGKQVEFTPSATGGLFIADGGSLYKNMGVDSAVRQTAVSFTAPEKNQGLISTLDTVKSSSSHEYTWQANLGAPRAEGDVKVKATNDGGRPGFLLEAGNGYVKGWVLNPADAKVKAGEPLQITTSGSEAQLWVVLYTGEGAPPTATISGEGMSSTLEVDGKKISFAGDKLKVE